MSKHEEKFVEVQEKAIVEAQGIDCPMSDYAEGLQAMREHLDVAIEAAEQDVKNNG